ncbi:MAG: hypothetical protein WC846_03460 [Candidatus Gracilibacteria bacterium]|jgi:hypothetical protein
MAKAYELAEEVENEIAAERKARKAAPIPPASQHTILFPIRQAQEGSAGSIEDVVGRSFDTPKIQEITLSADKDSTFELQNGAFFSVINPNTRKAVTVMVYTDRVSITSVTALVRVIPGQSRTIQGITFSIDEDNKTLTMSLSTRKVTGETAKKTPPAPTPPEQPVHRADRNRRPEKRDVLRLVLSWLVG